MDDKKVFIIAEAGVNHNGNINLAYQLVDKAVEAGVDAVKFQTFKAENLVSKDAKMAEYQKKNTGTQETQLQMIKKLELSYDNFERIKKYCDERKYYFKDSKREFTCLVYNAFNSTIKCFLSTAK
jgi:sialic acid synthase SpsE